MPAHNSASGTMHTHKCTITCKYNAYIQFHSKATLGEPFDSILGLPFVNRSNEVQPNQQGESVPRVYNAMLNFISNGT